MTFMTETMTEIAIIGAGPAGLMAADTACQHENVHVTLYEKNKRCGKKLLITGKGRCNLTNDCTIEEFIPNVVRGGKFLFSALNALSPADVMGYFQRLGVELKTERGRRVFPVSDRAVDIRDALAAQVQSHKNLSLCYEAVTKLHAEEQGFTVESAKGKKHFDKVIIATGGLSYPRTGSTGDGYRLASRLGHGLQPTRGSLVPFVCKEHFCSRLEGLSLRNVTLTVTCGKKKLFSQQGELLFTADGISGPLVLSASAHTDDPQNKEPYLATIDLKPALSREQADARLLSDFKKYINKDLINALDDLLPQKLIPVFIELSGLDPRQKVNEITKGGRNALLNLLKAFPLTICALRPVDEAVVTAGGIPLKEVSPKDMQSKLVPGLYFAGEILDADAYTGGYNLQIAFSTGYCAGLHCCD